ncbi:MAG: putative ABC transporter permease [Clostridia bacterium]|nr:putative ABC transporter permease [Clostridia bacterium]
MQKKILIFKDENYNLKTTFNMLSLIFVFSGIFGFIYETIFYRLDLGYFVKRGSTFGPWIPIYAFGGILITLISYRFKKKPILVFVTNCIITGILEYLTGWFLYNFCNGLRLWDYNIEILNFGNINGFICARSILFFGISGLLLIYTMIPIFKKILNKISERKISIISTILLISFVLDMVLFMILK